MMPVFQNLGRLVVGQTRLLPLLALISVSLSATGCQAEPPIEQVEQIERIPFKDWRTLDPPLRSITIDTINGPFEFPYYYTGLQFHVQTGRFGGGRFIIDLDTGELRPRKVIPEGFHEASIVFDCGYVCGDPPPPPIEQSTLAKKVSALGGSDEEEFFADPFCKKDRYRFATTCELYGKIIVNNNYVYFRCEYNKPHSIPNFTGLTSCEFLLDSGMPRTEMRISSIESEDDAVLDLVNNIGRRAVAIVQKIFESFREQD